VGIRGGRARRVETDLASAADGIVTFQDTNHLTATYTATLLGAVAQELEKTLTMPDHQ
jgi:hypothetical protein